MLFMCIHNWHSCTVSTRTEAYDKIKPQTSQTVILKHPLKVITKKHLSPEQVDFHIYIFSFLTCIFNFAAEILPLSLCSICRQDTRAQHWQRATTYQTMSHVGRNINIASSSCSVLMLDISHLNSTSLPLCVSDRMLVFIALIFTAAAVKGRSSLLSVFPTWFLKLLEQNPPCLRDPLQALLHGLDVHIWAVTFRKLGVTAAPAVIVLADKFTLPIAGNVAESSLNKTFPQIVWKDHLEACHKKKD